MLIILWKAFETWSEGVKKIFCICLILGIGEIGGILTYSFVLEILSALFIRIDHLYDYNINAFWIGCITYGIYIIEESDFIKLNN